MSDTDATRKIRTDFAYLGGTCDVDTYDNRIAIFDAWLAEHDRQNKEVAWQEGMLCEADIDWQLNDSGGNERYTPNPYRVEVAETLDPWWHTLSYAATALEGSSDNGDQYCAKQIRDHLVLRQHEMSIPDACDRLALTAHLSAESLDSPVLVNVSADQVELAREAACHATKGYAATTWVSAFLASLGITMTDGGA